MFGISASPFSCKDWPLKLIFSALEREKKMCNQMRNIQAKMGNIKCR